MSDQARIRLSYVLWGVGGAAVTLALLLSAFWHQGAWSLLVSTAGLLVALIGRRMRGRPALGIFEKLGKGGQPGNQLARRTEGWRKAP